jgi:hypothetical protein
MRSRISSETVQHEDMVVGVVAVVDHVYADDDDDICTCADFRGVGLVGI